MTPRVTSIVRLTEIPMPADDKDDDSFLRRSLQKRRKWLVAGAAGLVVVGVAATISSTVGSTEEVAQSASAIQTIATLAPPTSAPTTALVESFDWAVYQNNSAYSNITLQLEDITTSTDVGARQPSSTSPPETTASPSSTAPPRSTDAPPAAPTTAPPKLMPYTDTNFDWLNIRNWQGDNEVAATSFATSAFQSDRIQVSTFGRPFEKSPVLRTTPGWRGNRALFIEWTSYAGSDTNIWLLPTSLTSQFRTTAWPRCGEYDIFEMFNGDAAIGHKGTLNLWFGGGLEGFGQSTLHMSTTRCFAPFYPNGKNRPSSSSQSAQWQTSYGVKNSMAVIFGTDGNGKFIQQVQNPSIIYGPNNTADIGLDGANPAAKIYTNQKLYWGVPPVGGCAEGFDGGNPGFPFMSDDFRLILQEQYRGKFDVTNFKVFLKN